MSITAIKSLASTSKCEGMGELRRGPWTLEEDTLLVHCVACHGEGRWNLLARSAGLKRTGKSCRLRWLNYLKPDIKRGNLSLEEQLLILDLHSKWGNRWSRIAQHLPGRTDNEIKNYCRTRVQRQLKAEAHSALLREAVRSCWAQNFSSIPPPHMFDEMPPWASDELRGVTSFVDRFAISSGGGHCSVNNAYEVDPWNLAPTSVLTPTCFASEHTSCSNNDVTEHSSWSMDESSDMLKSYMSGAESEVPFGDDN
ncbi:transcription factor MYB78-like [Zingiber officinale]|uniref:MYB protein n=1 Tax=Zingiber officinale TaxID=94328 RepID=A0A8J5H300_ZINOF|nr:transcription factor MYB78-like [Zingiber officinale]KAG6508569.1 hypothetical protein ZIOFF_033943 [Zingiber officinale]WLQ69623.1 MYB protein [Zingiber officinale]